MKSEESRKLAGERRVSSEQKSRDVDSTHRSTQLDRQASSPRPNREPIDEVTHLSQHICPARVSRQRVSFDLLLHALLTSVKLCCKQASKVKDFGKQDTLTPPLHLQSLTTLV
jgi:hypothetical protein